MMVRTVDLEMASDLMPPAGSTPLHLAAHRGHVAILQAMLQVRNSQSAPLQCTAQPKLLSFLHRILLRSTRVDCSPSTVALKND